MKRVCSLLGVVLCTALLSTCGREITGPAVVVGPVALRIVGGDAQVGVAGQELPTPLRVLAQNDKGQPLRGFLVNFRVVSGGGRMYAGASLTDKDGVAQDYWTLGTALFTEQRVEVVAVDPTTAAKQNFGSFTARGASTLDAQVTIAPTSADLGTTSPGVPGAPTSFTVTNTGAATTGSVAAVLGDANAGDFQIVNNDCAGVALAMGQECTLGVRLNPTTAGSLTALLTASATPGGSASARLTGTSTGVAALAMLPASHDFGSITVGSASGSASFTVTNAGTAPSGALAVSLVGANVTQFQYVTNTCAGFVLAAQASCSVTVKYQPTGTGVHSATLAVTGAPGGAVAAVLTGTGTGSAQLQLTPASATFGFVAISPPTGIILDFTLRNTGMAPSGAISFQFTGAYAAAYSLVSNACGTAPLPAGGSCVVSVRFQPVGMGSNPAVLAAAASPGGTATAALNGGGLSNSWLAFFPPSMSFGSFGVGSVSGYQQIQVQNQGPQTGPLTVDIVGANAGDFSVAPGSGTCAGMRLATGQSCVVPVRFEPSASGARSATLQLVSDQGSGVAVLSGTGVLAPTLSISPTSYNFGTSPLGVPTAAQSFTVTNTGNASAGPLTSALTGLNSVDFHLVSNGCANALLAPAASCSVSVLFSPTGSGARSATLTVTGGGSAAASLSGSGVGGASLAISPTSSSFGTVPVGNTVSRTFIVSNSGGAASGTLGLALTGAQAGQFTLAGGTCNGVSLAAGASCTVNVQYAPTMSGSATATLGVSASPGGSATASLSGSTLVSGPALQVTPNPGDFGTVTVNSVARITFTVTSIGDSPVAGTSFAGLTGAGFMLAGNTCGAPMNPGATCTITIQFSASLVGVYAGSFTLNWPGAPIVVPLLATTTN